MVKSTIITALAAAMAIIPTTAFVAPIPSKLATSTPCTPTTMSMSRSSDDDRNPMLHKVAATAALAGACVLANVFTANVAFAMDDAQLADFGPTSTIIAGRGGGGRGGGRAMGGGGMSRGGGGMSRGGASYARPSGGGGGYSGGGTRVINRTYISPGIGISPFGMGYGYNPLGGIGLGYGLGAAGNIGNEIRDNRQEGEIQQERFELEQAKAKAAQLEARLAALEGASVARPALPPVQAPPLQVQ